MATLVTTTLFLSAERFKETSCWTDSNGFDETIKNFCFRSRLRATGLPLWTGSGSGSGDT